METALEEDERLPIALAFNLDALAILVTLKTRAAKAVRINITLPEDVLERIDRFAADRGLSRSTFLARAASREMERNAG